MVEKARTACQRTGASFTTIETLEDHDLGGVDCDKCNNTGYLLRVDADGIQWSRECPCMKTRRSLRNIRNSGIADMMKRYTFDNYIVDNEIRKKIKERAIKFASEDTGWFIITGRSGSGKSHICTAICGKLIEDGAETKYMQWRSDSVNLKAKLNTPEYEYAVQKYIDVPVLYIDDLFKGTITPADINLAFQILNGRYLDYDKRTTISSEIPMERMFDEDEAVAGRIYERTKGYCFKAPDENYRLRVL